MSVRSAQSITKEFRTRNFSTGVLTDADSTPTGTLYVNGTSNAATVTVTHHSTGKYKAAVTLPTLAIGDLAELEVAATVNSVSDSAIVWFDTKDVLLDSSGKTTDAVQTGDSYPVVNSGTFGNSALKTLIDTLTGYVDTEVAAIKAKTDNLPSDPADASDIAASFSSVAATLATIAGYIDTEVAAIKAKTDNLPASPAAVTDIPTAAQNAAGLLDLASAIEGYTPRQLARLIAAVLLGKSSNGGATFRDLADTKARVTAAVDGGGNRTAVTRDAT